MALTDVISKLIPVILIIVLGWILKKTGLVSSEGNAFLKKLIVNVGLPAVMVISFMRMTISPSLILFIPGIFLLNIILFHLGKLISTFIGGKYTPFLFTGFEYGMFAIAVFTAAYGSQSASYIAIIDLGHELFIWFVFVTLLLKRSGKKQTPGETLKSFVKSPIILGIITGIIVNILGIENFLNNNFISRGLITTAEMLMALTAPLILISIGAGLFFSGKELKFAFMVTAIRIPIVLILSFLIGNRILSGLLGLPFAYEAAVFTLFIAPPPFIIPLFIPESDIEERGIINTTLTLYTMVSLILFIIYFSFNPVL